MSLARVSVLDAKGDTILDEFVKQTATILFVASDLSSRECSSLILRRRSPLRDANEKFSGLTMGEMTSATKDLPAVRREMCRLIDEETIIIGHGYVTDSARIHTPSGICS